MPDIFPPITVSTLNQYPKSTDTSGVYTVTEASFFFNPATPIVPNAGLTVDANGALKLLAQPNLDFELVENLITNGILSGMTLSINNATTFNISAGKFIVQESATSIKEITITFVGANALPFTNPQGSNIVFVYIDAQSNITFQSTKTKNPLLCYLGSLRVDKGTTIKDVFNDGDYIANGFSDFHRYMSSFGVFHEDIDIRFDGTDSFMTHGGKLYLFGTTNGVTIQGVNPIVFHPIKYDNFNQPTVTDFTLTYLKYFYTDGNHVGDTYNQSGEYTVWLIYAALDGNFYLLMPQELLRMQQHPSQGEILGAIDRVKKPPLITETASIVAALLVRGTAATMADVEIYFLKNRFSNGINVGTGTLTPVPQPTADDEEKVLATDSSKYVLKESDLRARIGGTSNEFFITNNSKTVPITFHSNKTATDYYFIHLTNQQRSVSLPSIIFQANTKTPIGAISNIPNFLNIMQALTVKQDRLNSAVTTSNNKYWYFNDVLFSKLLTDLSPNIPNSTNLLLANSNYYIFLLIQTSSIADITEKCTPHPVTQYWERKNQANNSNITQIEGNLIPTRADSQSNKAPIILVYKPELSKGGANAIPGRDIVFHQYANNQVDGITLEEYKATLSDVNQFYNTRSPSANLVTYSYIAGNALIDSSFGSGDLQNFTFLLVPK